MNSYFIIRNGVQLGPFDMTELPQQELTAQTLVWTEGMADWQAAWQVDELRPLLKMQSAQTPPPPPPQQPAAPQPTDHADHAAQKPRRHTGCIVALVIVALLIGYMAASNPTHAEHNDVVKEHVKQGLARAMRQSDADCWPKG